jgi:hypothetical protein
LRKVTGTIAFCVHSCPYAGAIRLRSGFLIFAGLLTAAIVSMILAGKGGASIYSILGMIAVDLFVMAGIPITLLSVSAGILSKLNLTRKNE